MNDAIMIFSSIAIAFLLGVIAVALIGAKTTLNYFIVKISRGKKILLFVRTSFGWITKVGKKKENTILWTHDKVNQITSIEDEKELSLYGVVQCVYINIKNPSRALKIDDEVITNADFDMETYNNILIRAITRPNLDSLEKLSKLIVITIILGIICLFGIVLTYVKITDVLKAIATIPVGGVI
jgi:hypothetical protein